MNPTDDLDEDRLTAALREYQAAREAGRHPDRQEFLGRYADIADELADCLDGLELVSSVATRLGSPKPRPCPEPVEGVLGDFRLLREIGRGGMGVVYEAEQLSLGRRVALKVLPLAATLDARQLQRFENEARAAAHLHHGNIVPVFAVGRERGVPYYAMQLIEGRSLAAIIEDLRHNPRPATPAAETAANAASLTHQSAGSRAFFRAAARVGVQAAQALEYAHQMGVVHRDVKPANLLLDSHGKLWVADFGLARFQAGPGVTGPGDLVGTLRYMSPEQASGRPVIDPRTDVYGLGVTLYEVLTQQPAVTGNDRQDCFRQVLTDEPPAPRQINRAIPAELETIVLKAMAKSPDERYGSAGEMAADLERFLDDRPILARPPGLLERAAKWARRHSRVVAATALGLAAAVVVLAVTTWRVASAESRTQAAYTALLAEQDRTAAALKEEAAQHARAELNYRKAREVLEFLDRLGVEEMAGKPELQPLRRKLLAKLIEYYEGFIDQHRDDPEVADELQMARLQVSELLVEVGNKAEALAAFSSVMRDRLPFGFGRRGPPGPPRGIAGQLLLGQPAVQEELNLSPEQVGRVKALLDFDSRPPSNEEMAAADKGLPGVLEPDQRTRLDQIILQSRGAQVLLEHDVVTKLKLTERQKEQIGAALEKARHFGPHDRWMPGRPKGPRPIDPKQAEAEALKALHSDQRAAWNALRGKPFSVSLTVGKPSERPKPRGTTSFAYYEGEWKKLPDFERLTPVATGVGPAFDLGPARRPEHYAFRFEGYFRLEQDEECTFTLSSDDGSRLMIDGKEVVDNDGTHPARTKEGRVKLAKGMHRVVVTYIQAILDVSLVVEMRTPTRGRRNLGDLVTAPDAGN
jgi:tRNA A-37 threonylcarbamoyl transferase component Bud32